MYHSVCHIYAFREGKEIVRWTGNRKFAIFRQLAHTA